MFIRYKITINCLKIHYNLPAVNHSADCAIKYHATRLTLDFRSKKINWSVISVLSTFKKFASYTAQISSHLTDFPHTICDIIRPVLYRIFTLTTFVQPASANFRSDIDRWD